ncbi:ABC-type transporter, ATPase component [Paracholeplasma brassicae]|uniref:ABC-type transporter, ATPase component n=1 Tax=Acholeplasma brassicae TaxID=61635 RepID=U4KQF4_9MOLU|nr:ABC transporter ATP-binding protein [Paracholeplasma brassicae]CCV66695.1 ABC-type transporter, ATPase component [Paracholeplasma brassicae]
MIKIERVSHKYNLGLSNEVKALNNVSFSINDGDFIGIIGHSGSGKTTLLNVISGLLKPSEGSVTYDDKEIYHLAMNHTSQFRNRNIGFIFQDYYLEPKFTAFENVSIPLMPQKEWSLKEIESKVNEALDLVGLAHRKHHKAYQLSGGEKQRVAIARAIVTDAKVLFADEPTGNLDSKNSHEIMNLLRNLNKQGKTIVLITHKNEDTIGLSKVLFLKDGTVQ